MVRRRAVFLGLALIAALPACAQQGPSGQTAAAEQPRGAGTSAPPTSIEAIFSRTGFNKIANLAEAFVVGSVVEVGASRWNSSDGKEWANEDPHGVRAIAYYDVTIAVQEVLFDAGTIEIGPARGIEPGDTVVIRSVGARASDEDARPGVLDDDEWNGRFDEGSTMALMLAEGGAFPHQDGTTEDIVQVVSGHRGAWMVEERRGERFARSIDDAWSAPLDRLAARFDEERATGPSDDRESATVASIVPPDERSP